MRLTSLDIKGFKSFADKTSVTLDNAITGIVGPNGCGKSNIVDAIRWVIGEHKIKALRSDHLDDLIFNGSRTRSASGLAEVSLTFENTRNLLPTEFQTVTITRKFFKNGESEYRLNDVTCRLKDITNLFLDTGVSSDSYAIIELAMVDDIIRDKEGARRRMLEQAAGISIYKTRKKEARQKLDATEADLARIEDLLFEIAQNLRTLESQAKKAERYRAIKEEYKAVSIESAKASAADVAERYKTLAGQQASEEDRRAALDAELATEEAAVEEQKLALLAEEESLSTAQKAFNDLLARARAAEGEQRLLTQKLEHLQDRERALSETLSGTGEALRQTEAAIAGASQSIVLEEEALRTLTTDLDTARTVAEQTRTRYTDARSALDGRRSEASAAQHRRYDAEKRGAVAEAAAQNISRALQHLLEEEEARKKSLTGIERERIEAASAAAAKEAELHALTARQEEVKALILQSQESLEGLRGNAVEETRALDARRAEHDLLKSLVDSLEGYPDSIKFLKKNTLWTAGPAPLLGDLFVVQPDYRAAVESVLEPYLNHYVVDTVEEAAAGIRLLENSKKGKAAFIILNRLGTPEAPVEAARTPPHFHQDGDAWARTVVEVDDKYDRLAERLLGNVYILNTLPEGTVEDGYVLVDKTGRYKSDGAALTGGSVGAFEGRKIGRAKNLERLSAEMVQRTQTVADLRRAVAEKQTEITGYNAALADRAIEAARRTLSDAQTRIATLDGRAEHLAQVASGVETRRASLQTQLDAAADTVRSVRTEGERIANDLSALAEAVQRAEDAYREVEREHSAAAATVNSLTGGHIRQTGRLESLRNELALRTAGLEDIRRRASQAEEGLRATRSGAAETSEAIRGGENRVYALLAEKEQAERSLSEKDRAFYAQRATLNTRESALSGKRREREGAEAVLSGIREALGEMKLKLAGLKERLLVEFKVVLEDILDQPRTGSLTPAELEAEAERLKRRIEGLGEVNPTAVEAFTEMKARHDFIAEQKGDLVSAKDLLLQTIEEVEATANQKFRETFDAVRENFVRVFKALFTEDDNADLRLTDESNITESGIEIYAQPKGKKPSTLTQLSGGEKTLTSTAFLFAIYLIKPAPFCILDEVDAPLDDANVGKFTAMIRKFSDKSQFIIVTHNKQTMAAVDVIYGVTMQEPGVSKLVPVDFRSLN